MPIWLEIQQEMTIYLFQQLDGNYIIHLEYKDYQCSYYVKTVNKNANLKKIFKNVYF